MNLLPFFYIFIKSNLKIYFSLGFIFLILGFTISASFLYLETIKYVGIRDNLIQLEDSRKNIQVLNEWIPLNKDDLSNSSKKINNVINKYIPNLIFDHTKRIKTGPYFWGMFEEQKNKSSQASRAYFQELKDYQNHVNFIEGIAPSKKVQNINGVNAIEVGIYSDIRDEGPLYNLQVGDLLSAISEQTNYDEVNFIITGIFQEIDSSSYYWSNQINYLLKPSPPQDFGGREMPIIFLVDEDVMAENITGNLPLKFSEVFFLDEQKISLTNPAQLLENLKLLDKEINLLIPRSLVRTGIDSSIMDFQQKNTIVTLPSLLIGCISLSILLCSLIMVISFINNSNSRKLMMMKMRGISNLNILLIQFYNLIPFTVIPSILGITSAYLLVIKFRLFTIENYYLLDTNFIQIFTPQIFYLLFVILIGTFVFSLLSLSNKLRSSIVNHNTYNLFSKSFIQKYYIDLLIVIISFTMFFELRSRDFLRIDLNGEYVIDPFLFFTPIFLLISIILILIRLFPVFIKILLLISNKFLGVNLFIIFRRLSTDNSLFFWPVIIVTLSTSLAIIVGSLINTISKTSIDQINYENPSSLRIINPSMKSNFNQKQIDSIKSLESIDVISNMLRVYGKVGTTSTGYKFNLLGLEPEFFNRFVKFRDDFSEKDINQMIDQISVEDYIEEISMPEETEIIGIWAKQSPYVIDHFLWVVIKDSENRQFTLTFGQIPDKWTFLGTEIPDVAKKPIEIVSIQTFKQTGSNASPPTNLYIDDLISVNGINEEIIIDFEYDDNWTGLPTSNGFDTNFKIINEDEDVGFVGRKVAEIQLGDGTDSGVRGIYKSNLNGYIPAIVSKNFFDFFQYQGDTLVVEISGSYIPIQIIGWAKYFPTMNPYRDDFMIVDVNALLNFMKLRGLTYQGPNEILVRLDSYDQEEINEIKSQFRSSKLVDLRLELQKNNFDNLTLNPLKTFSDFSLILGTISIITGYIIFLFHSLKLFSSEYKTLSLLGLSKFQSMNINFIENLCLITFGIFGGIIAGYFCSNLIIDSITRSFFGQELLPPYLLQINWIPMLVNIFIIFLIISINYVISYRKSNY
tara:strand:+ start:1426 stop:4665 length:3240 start_codon:yes stop_codon:yes gene_type:complete